MSVLSREWISPGYRVRDDCGYRDQARRITDYQIRHTPESVLPFVRETYEEGCYPDGCGPCGKATWWESRRLPNGQQQTRCTECHDTITWD